MPTLQSPQNKGMKSLNRCQTRKENQTLLSSRLHRFLLPALAFRIPHLLVPNFSLLFQNEYQHLSRQRPPYPALLRRYPHPYRPFSGKAFVPIGIIFTNTQSAPGVAKETKNEYRLRPSFFNIMGLANLNINKNPCCNRPDLSFIFYIRSKIVG